MTSFPDNFPHHAGGGEYRVGNHQLSQDGPSLDSAHLLPLALSAAVPLRVYAIYQRNGPTREDWSELQHIGCLLAEWGQALLFRSSRIGETADVFNNLAEALAILSFLPAGISFGEQHFEALQILTAILGEEQANQYVSHVRWGKTEDDRDEPEELP